LKSLKNKSSFVLENHGKPQSNFCTNPVASGGGQGATVDYAECVAVNAY